MARCCVLWILVLCSSFLFKTVQSQETHVIAEKGQRTVLTCTLPSSATSVTWKVLRDSGYVNVSTCVPNSCTDQLSSLFKGNIARSADGYTSTLEIYNVTISDTHFICLTNTGDLAANIILDVYVSPSTPSCGMLLSYGQNSHLDLKCETDNVYPSFRATPHRRELDRFTVDENASGCTVYNVGTGSKGDRYGNCTWRIPFSNLRETNTFYVEMVAVVADGTPAGSRVFSLDKSVTLGLPNVQITDCAAGSCLRGSPIKVNLNSCCKCQLISSGLVSGRARWYTQDGAVVGTEDSDGLFSTLTVTYSEKGTNPIYQCRADNPSAQYHYSTYSPTFSSSTHQSHISGLTVVMGLGAVYATIALYLN
ncbi:hypothetical protein BsWGS_12389 [Bradybaena similaris]